MFGSQSAPANLLVNDYMTVTMITAVGYDYVLTLPKEIDYIWSKPWTWVTMLFIIVRYTGLCTIAVSCLLGSSFLPGPAKMTNKKSEVLPIGVRVYPFLIDGISHWKHIQCLLNSFDLAGAWMFLVFLVAADVVMILRVWAMYSQSRLILSILLATFFLEILFITLDIVIDSPPKDLPSATVQMLTFSFCAGFGTAPIPPKLAPISQIVHGTLTCTFAIVRFVHQSLQMRRTTKRWQANQYMTLLIKQDILYFFFILVLGLVAALGTSGKLPQEGWPAMLLMILEFVPLFTLTPRFIISIRELYARDAQGRCDSIVGIDTGFGLSVLNSDRGGAGEMAMVFAEVGKSEDEDEE